MKIYVASKLENIEDVKALVKELKQQGHEITYDWSIHGPVWKHGLDRIIAVSLDEMQGVINCDLLISLLPGGRGTHVEIGGALSLGKRVILCSADTEFHFGVHGDSCAFYHHPLVRHCTNKISDILKTLGDICLQ